MCNLRYNHKTIKAVIMIQRYTVEVKQTETIVSHIIVL